MTAKDIAGKLTGAFLLFLVTFLLALLPNRFKRFSEKFLKKMSSFSGGLFLGLCYLDLIPEAIKNFSQTRVLEDVQKLYPMAEFVICFGLILIFGIEKLVNKCQASKKTKSFVDCVKPSRTMSLMKENERLILDNSVKISYLSSNSVHNNHSDDKKKGLSKCKLDSDTMLADDQIICNSQENNTDLVCSLPYNEYTKNSTTDSLSLRQLNSDEEYKSKLRVFFLIIALSVHSFFEGLTLGLQNKLYGFIQLIAILAFHKCLMGFSLGVSIVSARQDLKLHFKQAFIFAISSPFGIILGFIIISSLNSDTNKVVSAILIALSTGTFVYVTFFEIIGKDINSNTDDVSLLVFFIFGFSLFALITAIPKTNI